MTPAAGSYTEFTNRLHGRVGSKRIPLDVSIEVTRRCPLACAHCYNNLPMADREARSRELRTEEHFRLLDELAAAGGLWLLFTGGEIFARADFLEIYLYAKRKGFLITLFTNGTLITQRIADTLAEYRPFSIEITLYGRTRETYERLTGVPGSYDRCLNGIRLLRERGLPLFLKTVAVSINRHEIPGMKAFVEEELGLPFKFDAMMTPRIDCSSSPLEVRLRPEEVVELDLGDPDRMRDWAVFARDFIRPQQAPGHEGDLYHCGGGVQSFNVAPDGNASLCLLSQQGGLDLRTSSVESGWTGYLSAQRARPARRVTKCTACQMKSVCGMCPANAELETGDPETPVDFLCHVAHLRALVFGWAFPEHGECEYCPGGARRGEIEHEAEGLKARAGTQPLPRKTVPLRVLRESARPAGGCGGGCADVGQPMLEGR
jgi:radical SAM protein with 4Fe4S-binding SPASM domain